jgi:hypothetical protein
LRVGGGEARRGPAQPTARFRAVRDESEGYLKQQAVSSIQSITNSGTDYIGIDANTANDANGNYTMYIVYGTFTGFHRDFTLAESRQTMKILIKKTRKKLKMIIFVVLLFLLVK